MTRADSTSAGRIGAILLIVAALGFACGGDDDDGPGLEEIPIEVGAEQEQSMCDDLNSNPSTSQLPKVAGAAIGEGDAIAGQPGKKVIEFVDFQGQQGGYIRLAIDPDKHYPVFLMTADDVGVAAVYADDTEVTYLESGSSSELCPEAAGRYLWKVEGGENHLRFGPTAAGSVDLVFETVD